METTQNMAVLNPGFDPIVRERALAVLESGMTKAELSRSAGINNAILVQMLNEKGDIYAGDSAKYWRKLAGYLDRRNLELLAGINTIPTPVSEQIAAAARMVQRCHIMGMGIGPSGIGKTRGAALLQKTDETTLVIHASREEGTREYLRGRLFELMGIRGGKNTNTRRDKYAELVRRLRGTEILLLVDQAHMLSSPAIDFLIELWNATNAPQLWLGTEKLAEKVARDEQWASRLEFAFPLGVVVDKEQNDVQALVQHQIKSRLPELNGEGKQLSSLCQRLALNGNFRRVEMRLATMLYLSEHPRNKDKSWVDLFEVAGNFLREQN